MAAESTHIPEGLSAYNRTPVFTEQTVPKALLADHNTKTGVWGLIQVESGKLRYTIPGRKLEQELTPGAPGVVKPEELHHVTPLGPVRFFVEFWR